MKSKCILKLFSLILLGICLLNVSCSDDNSGGGSEVIPIPNKPDFTVKSGMSVSGFIVDENDKALQNVRVQVGDSIATTDGYGHFIVGNVSLVENHSFVVAEKEGYFNSTRTWMGQKGGTYEVRLKMLPKTVAGKFSTESGGVVKSKDGVELNFPADAVTKADGTSYKGNVNVAIQWIDAVSADFGETMPGDLSAVNSQGNTVTLMSFGMAAVELRGNGNELLQVAKDKTVKMTTPIADKLQSLAEASIPMWYFDETKGMWIEEGVAKKEGNTFVGEVSHFSYWNLDKPEDYVIVRARLVNSDNDPISNELFEIESTSGYSSYHSTSLNGQLSFRMPINTGGGIFAVKCVTLIKGFTVFEEDIDLGTIVVNGTTTIIQGTIGLECDNDLPINANVFLTGLDKVRFVRAIDNKFKFEINSFCTDDKAIAKIDAVYNYTYYRKYISNNKIVKVDVAYGSEVDVPIILEDCDEATIKGIVSWCGDKSKPYEGGYVTFYNDRGYSVDTDIVNGAYELKVELVEQISGQFLIYDKDGYIVFSKSLDLFPNSSFVYDYAMQEELKLKGKVVDCNNNPITNGTVSIESSLVSKTVKIENGDFNIESGYYTCDDLDASITVRDYSASTEVTQSIKLKRGTNIIPNIKLCRKEEPVVEFNYFRYEFNDTNTTIDPSQVFGYDFTNILVIGGNALSTGQTEIILHWGNEVEIPTIGTFEASGTLYQKIDELNTKEYYIEGTVTITEIIPNNNYNADIRIKGTFEGVTEESLPRSGSIIRSSRSKIKGEFLYIGKNNYPT